MLKQRMTMIFLTIFMGSSTALADLNNPWDIFTDLEMRSVKCASHIDETSNISSITDKIHIFGVWKGEYNGDKVTATIGRDTGGKYKALAEVEGGSSYGPFNIRICDENGTFYGSILGYKARFVVISKTKMRVFSPLDQNESAEFTRQP